MIPPGSVGITPPRNSKDYSESTGTPLGLHWDWTGTGSGQLAGVGWGTSPSGVPVESRGKVGECKDLIFLGSCIFFAIIDLGGVFEVDAVNHMSGDMAGSVRKLSWELISISKLYFGVFSLECLLKCKIFNAASNSGHDRTQEEVTCQCRCSCFLQSQWFGDLGFFWSW